MRPGPCRDLKPRAEAALNSNNHNSSLKARVKGLRADQTLISYVTRNNRKNPKNTSGPRSLETQNLESTGSRIWNKNKIEKTSDRGWTRRKYLEILPRLLAPDVPPGSRCSAGFSQENLLKKINKGLSEASWCHRQHGVILAFLCNHGDRISKETQYLIPLLLIKYWK